MPPTSAVAAFNELAFGTGAAGSNESALLLLHQRMRSDDEPWELVKQALMFAAEAQQTIAEQRRRIAELETLSNTDELTGLFNRRGLERALDQVLAMAARHGESGVLAYIDLDGFKTVNDEHGHHAGDAMLRRTGRFLAENLRGSDLVARLGGDEFAVVLVRTTAQLGRRRAAALQRRLDGEEVLFGGLRLPLKASFGIAAYGPGSNVEELIRRADMAMYRNKRLRRRAALANRH